MGTVPLNNAKVEFILQAAQAVTIGVDQGDIVVLSTRFSARVPPT
jgi:hypothetical protein